MVWGNEKKGCFGWKKIRELLLVNDAKNKHRSFPREISKSGNTGRF